MGQDEKATFYPKKMEPECALTNYSLAICRDRSLKRCSFFVSFFTMTRTSSKLLSALTVTTIGLTSKAFLNSGLCSIQVNGLQTLKDALKSHKRNSGQGIITGSRYFQPQSTKSLNYNKCLIISQRAWKFS